MEALAGSKAQFYIVRYQRHNKGDSLLAEVTVSQDFAFTAKS